MSEAARSIVVLADCHIHPGGGIDWPAVALEAFKGADFIVTLGDMGEAGGLETLAKIAPVAGVLGADDAPSPYTDGKVRVLDIGGVAIGCVFDPLEAGLASAKDPFAPAPEATLKAVLGVKPDVLLWASTHVPSVARIGGLLAVNPGSATLPDKGSAASFARLTIKDGAAAAEIVAV
ncbi:MAG: metallophosphoesterase family protein [Caulobacteraceae bacterium]